ncbi:MAG TPA: hypothetical protein VJ692_05600 [Nitrospiraceae bacterium]|nr:hypothetical protein [Nitrospiraceae bacterium]
MFRRDLSTAMLLCLCLAGPLWGCSSKGPQYPEDHARYRRIDAAVEELRNAYVKKNPSAVESLMLPVEALDRIQLEIKRDFQEFQEIALDFAIDRIVIEGENIDVYVHWQGQWKRDPADAGVRDRGHGMLRWVGVQSILLNGVDGDLPFGMATRHTVPAAQPAS